MTKPIQAAEVVIPCAALPDTLAFFIDELGFRLDAVFPADDPAVAVIRGYGVCIRLVREGDGAPGTLRLACSDPDAIAGGTRQLRAPNGTRVELVAADPPLVLPPARPSFVVTRLHGDAPWVAGRAGMRYRDLIPDRQGGRFIASHIHIPTAGPVPDYVHWHKIHFQMIYCYRGWARLVYEGQGEPFALRAGDCVLQPPRIRHRVLESSADLEVVELCCPAAHETFADHDLALPTAVDPARLFDGQRFVRHQAATATWQPWRVHGFESRDTGIAAATRGIAGVCVVRVAPGSQRPSPRPYRHDAELSFVFVLAGGVTLTCEGHGAHALGPSDAAVVPAGLPHTLSDATHDLEFLAVALPGFDTLAPVA